ncbi:MAG TPA: septal ring lytic transglycosylase RlpA family protein [Xanthobacteraceae bacterium]|nr:septal ring lytic transglycosylase RlpA family protein [Xanthobacteraceae bacterium]
MFRLSFAAIACLFLANCASSDQFARQVDPRYGVSSSPRVVEEGKPIPKGGGVYRVGKPYQVAGRMYVPEHDESYSAEGIASWYGSDFHGRLTANGEVYDKEAISAAHPTLPLPCYARVTNLANGRSIIVRVNDRGPYAKDRVIDLSSKTAELLGYKGVGLARVRVEYAGPAPLEGTDDRMLLATLRSDGRAAPAPSVLLASNSSYLPASASSANYLRRGNAAPIPPDRPFELGDPDPRSVNQTARQAAANSPWQSAGFANTPPPANASSYAAGFVSGRGLY